MEYWYNKNIQKVNEYKHLIMLDLETKGLKNCLKEMVLWVILKRS